MRRPRHHRASTRRLAGARPDAVHRGWIHPLHDRAVDMFRPLLTPVHWGVFVTAATPWECARTLRFRPAQSIPRSPSQSGRFFAIHLLQTLKKAALNAYFCLFAIWPVLCPFQPDFRSYFAPRLCICTNLDLTLMTLKSAYNIPRLMGDPDRIRHPLCSRRGPAERHRPRSPWGDRKGCRRATPRQHTKTYRYSTQTGRRASMTHLLTGGERHDTDDIAWRASH